jgi:RNA polymerase sigma factor (sigma-70 family)
VLTVLDADPVRAEELYRTLRRDLIRYLEWWGCHQPEDVADEALYRGLKRLGAGVDVSSGGPRAYVFGVAKMVAKEGVRSRSREEPLDPAAGDRHASSARHHEGVEAKLTLDRALRQLPSRDRSIIVRYCTEDDHGPLSRDLGVTPGNLRLIVHRIRRAIRKHAR